MRLAPEPADVGDPGCQVDVALTQSAAAQPASSPSLHRAMVQGAPGFALVIHGGCAPVIARLPRVWKTAYRRARSRSTPRSPGRRRRPVHGLRAAATRHPQPHACRRTRRGHRFWPTSRAGRPNSAGPHPGSSGPHPSRRARPITSRTGLATADTKQPTDQGDACGRQITTKHLPQHHQLPSARGRITPRLARSQRLIGAGSPQSIEILKPVTNQVTTAPGDDRRSATYSDTRIAPTCGNPTQPDGGLSS